jgi:hypothetical protein
MKRLACLEAEVEALENIFESAKSISAYFMDKFIDKSGEIAVIRWELEHE